MYLYMYIYMYMYIYIYRQTPSQSAAMPLLSFVANTQTGSEWLGVAVSEADSSVQPAAVKGEAVKPEAVQQADQAEPEPVQPGLLVRLHPDQQYLLESMDAHLKNVESACYFMEFRLPEKQKKNIYI